MESNILLIVPNFGANLNFIWIANIASKDRIFFNDVETVLMSPLVLSLCARSTVQFLYLRMGRHTFGLTFFKVKYSLED